MNRFLGDLPDVLGQLDFQRLFREATESVNQAATNVVHSASMMAAAEDYFQQPQTSPRTPQQQERQNSSRFGSNRHNQQPQNPRHPPQQQNQSPRQQHSQRHQQQHRQQHARNTADAVASAAQSAAAAAFAAVAAQASQASTATPSTSMSAPPASTRAIRQLPVILVQPEDLIDPTNRECCVCLDEIHIDERVLRLPCAHIFHKNCIVDWLQNHHCTCPTCRYELPTDNPLYEVERIQRMKLRKPRFAKYELERMSISELSKIFGTCPSHILDKNDWINHLISTKKIDIIEVPPPNAKYKLSCLKKMKISQLRSTMNDAGVFFNPQDVVEKQDMLHIFTNSGRVLILPEEKEDEKKTEPNMNTNENIPTNYIPKENSVENTTRSSSHSIPADSNARGGTPKFSGITVETVSSEDEKDESEDENHSASHISHTHSNARGGAPKFSGIAVETVSSEDEKDENEDENHSADPSLFNQQQSGWSDDVVMVESTPLGPSSPVGLRRRRHHQGSAAQHESAVDLEADWESEYYSEPALVSEPRTFATNAAPVAPNLNIQGQNRNDCPHHNHHDHLKSQLHVLEFLTISELRSLARPLGIDLSRCIERKEMVKKIFSPLPEEQSHEGYFAFYHDYFQGNNVYPNWSVSEIRKLANLMNVDLTHCNNLEEMIQLVLIACCHNSDDEDSNNNNNNNEILQSCLLLKPLRKLTMRQLHLLAKDWNVPSAESIMKECLEKAEIIFELISYKVHRTSSISSSAPSNTAANQNQNRSERQLHYI